MHALDARLTFKETIMRKKIFTAENIERLRAMKAIGASRHVMALAIGAKTANSFSARASKLGIFKQSDEVVTEAAAA
jgi:hypothetical protein